MLRLHPTYCALLLLAALFGGTATPQLQRATTGHQKMALTVGQAIELALEHNRTLGIARLDVKHSEAQAAKTRADYFPKVSNTSEALYVTDLQGVVIPAGALSGLSSSVIVPPRTDRIGQGALAKFVSGTELTQPLTQLLKLHAANRAARSDVETAKLGVELTEEKLAIEVRQLFYTIQVARRQQQAAQEQETATAEVERETRAGESAGNQLSAATLEASADFLEAKQNELQLRLEVRDKTLQLNDLLGLPLDTHFLFVTGTMRSADDLPPRVEGVRLALSRQPAVRSAEEAVTKAELSLVQQREQSEVDIENAYDQVDQGALAVNVGQQVLKLRVESAREADSSYAQGAILQSKRISAHVAVLKAEASELEAEMNLDLARNEAKRLAGEIPR